MSDISGKAIGIRAVQSVVKNATQSNLSMFHNAGNVSADILPRASVKEILDCSKTMNSYSSCKLKSEVNPNDFLEKEFIYAKFNDFLMGISASAFLRNDKVGDMIYDYLDITKPEQFVRFYMDPRKFMRLGYTLEDIANSVFQECNCILSPDFMGIIDVEDDNEFRHIPLNQMMEQKLGGYNSVTSCIVKDDEIILMKGCIESLLSSDISQINTIISNDIFEVEKYYGVEAAQQIISELLGGTKESEIIADFMTRSGKIVAMRKDNISKYGGGFIADLSFERARDTIIKSLDNSEYSVVDDMKSIRSRIWAGMDISK